MSTIIPGKCEDFDECSGSATVNSATEYAYNCAANSYCLNTIGSHLCICNDGFMGNGMDITGGCSDIDEWLVSKFNLLCNQGGARFSRVTVRCSPFGGPRMSPAPVLIGAS